MRGAAKHDPPRPALNPAGQGIDHLRRAFSRPLGILMAVVAALLLIACANIAGLLLSWGDRAGRPRVAMVNEVLARKFYRDSKVPGRALKLEAPLRPARGRGGVSWPCSSPAWDSYGTLGYSVARWTPEIGLRMALGAQRGDVVRLVLYESLAPVATGLVLDLAGALVATRLVQSLLFGLTPNDPPTLAGAVLVLLLSALIAAWLPAHRASRLDAMSTLRCD